MIGVAAGSYCFCLGDTGYVSSDLFLARTLICEDREVGEPGDDSRRSLRCSPGVTSVWTRPPEPECVLSCGAPEFTSEEM